MKDENDEIANACEDCRPILMSLNKRMDKMESAIYGDKDARVDGLGEIVRGIRDDMAALRKSFDSIVAKGIGAAAVLGIILPIVVEWIKKAIGF